MAGWTNLPVEIKFKILSLHLTFTIRDLHTRRDNSFWEIYAAPSCWFTNLIRVDPALAPEAERLIKLENDKIMVYKTTLEQISTNDGWMELVDQYYSSRTGLNQDTFIKVMKKFELEVPALIRDKIRAMINLELELLKECLSYVDFAERMNRLEGA